jgi:hypothetical protein
MHVNVSFKEPCLYDPGNPMEIWYDMPKNVTTFYHTRCD